MTGVLQVGVGAEADYQGRQEAEVLSVDAELRLLVVQDGQQVDLSDCLWIDQPPEIADHPHGGGLEYFVLSNQNSGCIDWLSQVEVGLEDEVVVVHVVIPEQRRHQKLYCNAGEYEERSPVGPQCAVEAGGEGGREVGLDVVVAQAVLATNRHISHTTDRIYL